METMNVSEMLKELQNKHKKKKNYNRQIEAEG